MKLPRGTGWLRALILCSWIVGFSASQAADPGQRFASPQAACDALVRAARTSDRVTLRQLLGLRADDVVAADQIQAARELDVFAAAYDEKMRLVRESETRYMLEVGADDWPFPIPIVQQDEAWYFDTEAGLEEILNRRIGRNELAVLRVIRAYVDAQREYASRDRDDDDVLEYAQRFQSTEGTRDGLYWPPEADGELSPLGPLVAQAQVQGYQVGAQRADPEPFHGYYFKILTRQGSHAPGGKYRYVINGNMIGGFGLIAWPAQHGESGIMTFTVNQQGLVHQKDLGPRTSRTARALTVYDPDNSWSISPE
jgi:hypothetical protein